MSEKYTLSSIMDINCMSWLEVVRTYSVGGGGATRLLPRDGGVDELTETTVGRRSKIRTRGQKWKSCKDVWSNCFWCE